MATFDPSSREREARAEMQATKVPPLIALVLIALTVLPILAFPVLELRAERSEVAAVLLKLVQVGTLSPQAWNTFLRDRFAELTRTFDEQSVLARTAQPWTQAILTEFLRFGNEQAFLGLSNTLQYRGDFRLHTLRNRGSKRAGIRAAQEIQALNQFFQSRGQLLFVVVVPSRAAWLPPEPRGSQRPYPRSVPFYSALFRELHAANVAFLDPTEILSRLALLEPPFLRTDTHWTPRAVELVTREVALRLREMAKLPPGAPDEFEMSLETRRGTGDLVQLLRLPAKFQARWQETLTQRVVRHEKGRGKSPVVLVLGDSFAGASDLPDLLAYQLGLPVVSFIKHAETNRRYLPMLQETIERELAPLSAIRVAVLVVTARNLD